MDKIFEYAGKIFEWLGVEPVGLLFLSFAFWVGYKRFGYYQDALKGRESLQDIRARLNGHGQWRQVYFAWLRQCLAWADGWLGASPWSTKSYDVTLRLALAYPIVSLLIVWMVTGENTSGIFGMLAEDVEAWRRVLAMAAVGVSVVLFLASIHASGWRQRLYIIAAAGSGVVGGFTGAGAGVFAGALAFAVVVSFANVVAVAVAVAVVVAIAFAVAVATVDGGVGVVATGAFLFYAADSIVEAPERPGVQRQFYLLYVPSMLLGLGATTYSLHYLKLDTLGFQAVASVLIFVVLLPLINSVFDWLSLVATRWLLRHVAEGQHGMLHVVGKAAADLAIGVALLAALAVTCTAAVQTMNLLRGREFLDVGRILGLLRTDPGNPSVWWVYFTLFSTLLPTLAHVVVAAGSCVTWSLPGRVRRYLLEIIDPQKHDLKENPPLLARMARYLTVIDALALALGGGFLALLAGLTVWFLPGLGHALLWLCEVVAFAMIPPR